MPYFIDMELVGMELAAAWKGSAFTVVLMAVGLGLLATTEAGDGASGGSTACALAGTAPDGSSTGRLVMSKAE